MTIASMGEPRSAFAPPLRRLSILLIEDNPGDEALVRAALSDATHVDASLHCRATLAEGRAALAERSFDCVLLDLSLPDCTGLDTLLRLKADAPELPVVVFTGHADEELAAHLVRCGAQETLLKDELVPGLLVRTLRHAVERARILADRRRAELALRRSEASFRTLIESAGEAIAVQQHGLLVYVNPAFTEYLGGAERDQLLGKPIADFVHPEDHGKLASILVTGLAAEGSLPALRDIRLRRSDEMWLDAEVGVIEVHYGDGPAVLLVARDLTERRRVQARAIQADRTNALGTFAAGMAHEINNPLSYVIGNLDFLADEVPRLIAAAASGAGRGDPAFAERVGEVRETIGDAREGSERVRALVADLKVLSRTAERSEAVAVDAEVILEAVLRLMASDLRSRARVERRYEPVPRVRADAPRLSQVFVALIYNAIQALTSESPEANEIALAIHMDEPGRVKIDVSDNGEGIGSDVIDRVFDPFFTTKEPGSGAGLGLAICQTIVGQLEGELTVESTKGLGSTFRIVLPAVDETRALG